MQKERRPSRSNKARSGRAGKQAGHAPPDRTLLVEGGVIAVQAPPPGLHIVATPIGNLGDITLRALHCLAGADLIACEDSRVTGRLLDRYGISTRRIAYHDHNAAKVRPGLMAHLAQGGSLALVSDAGTPLVSDPGYRLVRETVDAGHPVFCLPGPAAPIGALVLSGLPSDRFFFEGFLPPRQAARRTRLAALKEVPGTLLFFESPRRLAAALDDMAAIFGPRQGAVIREMTKRFEEVRRASLVDLAAHYREAGPPKGEIVIAVAPPGRGHGAEGEADLDTVLADLLRSHTVRDAAAEAARLCRVPKSRAYERALALGKGAGG